jgi:hypothetical protein
VRSWAPVVAVLFVASCGGGDGGRAFGVPGSTDTDDVTKGDEPDSDDPLDSISESLTATQGATSSSGSNTAGPSSDPSSGPEPSSGDPTGDPTTDSTTGPAPSSSSSSSEAEGTTSCDRLAVTWGDCLNYGVGECENDEATCIVDDPMASTLGTCALLDCVNDCDCPDAPPTGTAESACDSILVGGQTACYLDCSGGATCPDGMECWQNQICMFADLVCVDPPATGVYGDCVDVGTSACGGGADPICLVDDPDNSTTGVCAFQGCLTDCDCPAVPVTGTAPVTCGPIVADSDENACFLDCSAGQTCPDGMTCFMDFICMW